MSLKLQADRVRELFGVEGDVIQIDAIQRVTVENFLVIAGFGELPAEATIEDMIEFDGGRKGYIPFFQQFLETPQ